MSAITAASAMKRRALRGEARRRRACASCSQLKKRCDRALPVCFLCQKQGRACLYSGSTQTETPDESIASSDELATTPRGPQSFQPVYFLDLGLFRQTLGHTHRDQHFDLPANLRGYIGNLESDRTYVALYFRHVHTWAPFIARRHFLARVLSPLRGRTEHVGDQLLLASIKLITTRPSPDNDMCTPEYEATKAALTLATNSGFFDLRVLQSLIIMSLYEVGHAIYPAAYLTIGLCVRFGHAFGVHESIENVTESRYDSIESEERRRAWWMIILLDRQINMGCPERPTLIQDPSRKAILPIDDHKWDQADVTSGHGPSLSTPPTAIMGRFCLMTQAVILVGQVLSHKRRCLDNHSIDEDDVATLDGALRALSRVSMEEGWYRSISVCSPTTICYSARLLLGDCSRTSDPQKGPMHSSLCDSILSEAARELFQFAHQLNEDESCGIVETTPFCIEAVYRAGVYYARVYRDTQSEGALETYEEIKKMIRTKGKRWKSSTPYLEMLEARNLTDIL